VRANGSPRLSSVAGSSRRALTAPDRPDSGCLTTPSHTRTLPLHSPASCYALRMLTLRSCAIGVVTVLLVSGVAGCGGGDSSSPTAPTAVETATPVAATTPGATATGTSPYGVCAVTASEAMLPPTFTVVTIPEGDPLHGVFNTCMKTFGISHLAAAGYPDENLVHVSTVTAEYLDNDENGFPDNAAVNMALQSNHATFVHVSAAGGYNDWGAVRDLPQVGYITEMTLMWAPNGLEYESVKGGTWCGIDCGQPGDGETLEHIPELIQKAGYAKAYPSDFGMESGTLALAMDAARGGGWYVPDIGWSYGAQ
jgi:hypothetical protein